MNLSLREPRLRYDHQSWENYHYYNRVHVGHPGKPMNCPDGTPTYEFISVGFAKGQFVRNTFDNEIIIEAFYHAPASPDGLTPAQTLCQEIRTGIKAVDSTALTFKVHWSSDYGMGGHWLNGAWHVDVWRGRWDTLAILPMKWEVSPTVEYGQEIWARRFDKSTVIAALNIGHKANIKDHTGNSLPWYDTLLHTDLQGRSGSNTDQPFSVTDLRTGDYTSIASCVPVGIKCE